MFVHVFVGCLNVCAVQQDLKKDDHLSNIEILSIISTHLNKKFASPKSFPQFSCRGSEPPIKKSKWNIMKPSFGDKKPLAIILSVVSNPFQAGQLFRHMFQMLTTEPPPPAPHPCTFNKSQRRSGSSSFFFRLSNKCHFLEILEDLYKWFSESEAFKEHFGGLAKKLEEEIPLSVFAPPTGWQWSRWKNTV